MHQKWISFVLIFFVLFTFIGCKPKPVSQVISEPTELSGAGATFPKVLYEKYFSQYDFERHIKVNYQGVGSGAGIKNLIQKMVDFGATDAPMNAEEEKDAGAPVIHVPTALGAVVVVYNIPKQDKIVLNLDASVISKIFLGKITKWSDPEIKKLNQTITFPNENIIVIHRSESSGTTYTFTDFLNKADKDWSNALGKGKTVNWPVGLGGKGNDGVAGLLKQTPYSIGYVEYIYAVNNSFTYAAVKNKTGNFIAPTLKSVASAANIDLQDDLKVSITDTEAPDGYPISTFTWLLAYKEQNYNSRTSGQALSVANLLWWTTHQAQYMNEELSFGKLAPKAVEKAEVLINSMTFDGKPIKITVKDLP